jgi:hypothetical protein
MLHAGSRFFWFLVLRFSGFLYRRSAGSHPPFTISVCLNVAVRPPLSWAWLTITVGLLIAALISLALLMLHTSPDGSFVTNERNYPMEPTAAGNAFERGLHVLERLNDPELVEAYRQYMQRLETLIGRDKLDTYARVYQQDRRQLNQNVVGGTLTAEERTVRDTVAADPEVHALYDQYIALVKARGIADPQFGDTEAPVEE